MSRVFRSSYTDRKGRKRTAPSWYVELRDHRDVVRRFAAFTDKRASQELGRKLEDLVALRVAGERPSVELARWLEGLPPKLLTRLAKLDLIKPGRVLAAQPLKELVERFAESLRSQDRTEKHVQHVVRHVTQVAQACGFGSWSDIEPGAIERHLAMEREQGLSARGSNHRLASCKQFARWVVDRGLAPSSPLVVLKPLNARVDRRRERAPLDTKELLRLLAATEAGPEKRGLTGPVRALLYRVAAETGFRATELTRLRVADFDLDADAPCVSLGAEATKNRADATLPLRQDTARALAPLLGSRAPWQPAFPAKPSWTNRAAAILREDLERVGIPYQDASGRFRDFHALRGALSSRLLRHGANPRAAQSLSRHATASFTLERYARLRPDDERRALEALPSLDLPEREERWQTGTDVSASCSAFPGTPDDTQGHSTEPFDPTHGPKQAPRGQKVARTTGLEPATSGVTGRHSNRLSYVPAQRPGV